MSTIYQINDMAVVSSIVQSDVFPAGDASSTVPKRYTLGQIHAGLVNVTAATVTITAASHAGAVVTLNRAAGIAVTLPAASGSGYRYRFIVGTTVTSNTTTIKVANTSDSFVGNAIQSQDAGPTLQMWEAVAGDDTITFNGSTTGGIAGDEVEVIDIGTNKFFVRVIGAATGVEATPFSATV